MTGEFTLTSRARAAGHQENNPRRRAMLGTLIRHLTAAWNKDVAARMATLSDDFSYHLWQDGKNIGPDDKAGCAAFYEYVFGTGVDSDFRPDRFIVADGCIVCEGVEVAECAGEDAARLGAPGTGPGERWRSEVRACVLWEFTEDGEAIRSVTGFMSPWPSQAPEFWRRVEPVSGAA